MGKRNFFAYNGLIFVIAPWKWQSELANWGQGFQKCGLFLVPISGHM